MRSTLSLMLSHSTRSHIGLVMVILLCLFPIVPWLTMKPFDLRFGIICHVGDQHRSTYRICSVSECFRHPLYLYLCVLSGSRRTLVVWTVYSKYIDTLAHRFSMLIHPSTLATAFVPVSVASAALFLLPTGSDVLKTLGIMALLMMMSLIAITLYAHWRYQVLLKTHKILSVSHSCWVPCMRYSSQVISVIILHSQCTAVV